MAKARASSKNSYQPIDMSSYQELDLEWRKIGLSAPARKALVDAKCFRVSDLRKMSLEQLSELEGVSNSSLSRIKQIMQAKKIRFLN